MNPAKDLAIFINNTNIKDFASPPRPALKGGAMEGGAIIIYRNLIMNDERGIAFIHLRPIETDTR